MSGRGFTGGSYVGEASILEILGWIRANYIIDEDRIYVLGTSNGGYATYALAQNHPSLPAAIFPCIGNAQMDIIENLSNIPTYQFVSPKDVVFSGHEMDVSHRIQQYGNYHQFDFEGLTHHDMMQHFEHRGVLNEMLRHKRDPYPRRILFRTCRNRHLESYWIRLHGITRGQRFADVDATMESVNLIRITAHHTDGLTVILPPQIDKSRFQVVINRQGFSFEGFSGYAVTFVHKKGWKLTTEPPAIDFRKGTGLADVYMGSLRLILPEGAGEELTAVADRYAHPHTQGYDPKIYVDYPVYTADKVPDHIFSHHLILFDRTCDNAYVRRFQDELPVQYDSTGFTYQGKRYEGGYIIRQVIPHPYNPRLSIMVYGYNEEKLLRKELFSSRVILPYYVSGHHPFWNNEIVIYYQDTYWAAYEEDAPLLEI